MVDTIFVQIDKHVAIVPGEPFRLFPFGTIVKDGNRHELTPEIAAAVRLPHFSPPIKLGSHKDETPAAGFIKALEVRADGLYAVPEWNEAGKKALDEGAFRYHSPEIIWDGVIEDSANGETIEGTIIMGAALLHTPALGEAAAFFEITVETKGENGMSDNTVSIPASLWERTLDAFKLGGGQQEPPQPQGGDKQDYAAEVEEFKATAEKFKADYEAAQAKIATMEAEKEERARVTQFSTQLAETKLKGDDEFAAALAAMDEEHAELVVQKVKALSAQADESLEQDVGSSGDDGEGIQAFEAAVQAKMKDAGLTRSRAYEAVIRENGDLYKEALTNE